MRGTVFKRRVGKARLTYGVTVPAGICIGCITLAASHLPGPLLTASFAAATSGEQRSHGTGLGLSCTSISMSPWSRVRWKWCQLMPHSTGQSRAKEYVPVCVAGGLQFLVKQPMKTSLGRWYNNKDLKGVREWVSLGKGLCGKGKQNSEALRPQHGWKFPKNSGSQLSWKTVSQRGREAGAEVGDDAVGTPRAS